MFWKFNAAFLLAHWWEAGLDAIRGPDSVLTPVSSPAQAGSSPQQAQRWGPRGRAGLGSGPYSLSGQPVLPRPVLPPDPRPLLPAEFCFFTACFFLILGEFPFLLSL